MLTIYSHLSTRSLRIVWMAEEMGLAYQVRPEALGRPSPELQALNPIATLPTVVDGDLVMTESTAVLQVMAHRGDREDLAPGPNSPHYPAFLECLHYGEASLAAFLTPLVHTRFMAPDDQKENWTAKTLGTIFVRRLAFAERRLGDHLFLVGDTFTAADICIGYSLNFGAAFGLDARYPPAVLAYWARLKDRPAYQRAIVAVDAK